MNVNDFDVDESIRPQNDFFKYVNNKMLNKQKINDDQALWSYSSELSQKILQQIKEILEENHSNQDYKKISDFYKSGMNILKIEQDGLTPLEPFFQLVDQIKNCSDIPNFLSKMIGFGNNDIFFGRYPRFRLFSTLSLKDYTANEEILFLFQGGIGLPDRAYYFDDTKKDLRNKYVKFIEDILVALNLEEQNVQEKAKLIFDLETKLAEVTFSNVEKNDLEKWYHKFSINELEVKFNNFPWKRFFENSFDCKIPYISLDNVKFFETLIDLLIKEENLDLWKYYFKFKIICELAPYLTDKIYQLYFNFYEKNFSGLLVPKPRYEFLINSLGEIVGELIGKAYVERFFPEQSKVKIQEMVGDLKETFREILVNLDWMGEETKKYALKKLDIFQVKIGYADVWNDFSELNISENYSFVQNMLNSRLFKFKTEMKGLYKTPDKNKWLMPPYQVNAYNNPFTNELVFPAGILQFPYFELQANDPMNFGAIGSIISHEMTHGFDINGRKYDYDGNLKNWWTEKDLKIFVEKSKYFVNEYNKLKENGININGELTLGENMADIGGLTIAYYALQKRMQKNGIKQSDGGWTAEQEFFLAFARGKGAKIRPEHLENMIKTNPHAPPKSRINGAVANLKEFHEAFDVKEGDNLYRSNIEKIW